MLRLPALLLLFVPVALSQSILQGNASPLAPSPGIIHVQLNGSASWNMGTDNDSGPVTLEANRSGKSRMDLQLSGGQRSEILVNDPTLPKGYVYSNSEWKESAVHNSWVDANWFFPAFSTLAVASERGFALFATGANSYRSQFSIAGQKPRMTQLIQILSIADFDLDPITQLPTRMLWVTHPDDDYGVSIRVEVRYSDYRNVSGVKVPFHVERYFNGTLQLEVTISNVALNPGLSATDFVPSTN